MLSHLYMAAEFDIALNKSQHKTFETETINAEAALRRNKKA